MKQTLVLIPGFANTSLAWQHQVEKLQRDLDVHIDVMDRSFSRDEMTKEVLQNAPEHFFLAGHSMGGWIAQRIAAEAPKRVQKLILLNTWASLSSEMMMLQQMLCTALRHGMLEQAFTEHVSKILHPGRLQESALLQVLGSMLQSFPLETLVGQLEAMLADPSSVHYHSKIHSPTLIVHSSHDALFPEEHKALATGIKGATLAQIEECGHSSLLEKPEKVAELLTKWIFELS